jgi:Rieske Fe-S protein
MKRSRIAIFTILFLSLTACSSLNTSGIPAIPVEKVVELGGVVRISLPIKIRHTHFQYSYYDEYGETKWDTKDVELFPTDVFVYYDPDNQIGRVFLARSPHMGCLLNWRSDTHKFEDPCTGSRFAIDGTYESGPSPRSLDELPAELRDGMIWINKEVTYGQGHP